MNLPRTRFLLKYLMGVLVVSVALIVMIWRQTVVLKQSAALHHQFPIASGSITVDQYSRSFLYYVPPNLPPNAPLVMVLHGASQTAQNIRAMTGYEFEELANSNHFIVVYPNGYLSNWNDCRIADRFSARNKNVNDEAFLRDIITHFEVSNHINPHSVFAAGYSNGGQMAYRLAVEMPQDFAGIATISANLPTPTNDLCTATNQPIPILIMAGTSDRISPYGGGVESFFGKKPRGFVLSSLATVHYFVTLNGQTAPPTSVILPHNSHSGNTSVRVTTYNQPDKKAVVFYTVINGGHVIPTSHANAPAYLGQVTRDVDAPHVIWNFFSQQIPSAQLLST